jgi:hypothetical protein
MRLLTVRSIERFHSSAIILVLPSLSYKIESLLGRLGMRFNKPQPFIYPIYHIDDISRDEPFTVTVKGKPFGVVPYTIRNNDIVRFDSPATTNAAYLQDLKDEFDVLYAEAASRRRMMSISTHDRISGIPGRVKLVEEFIKYAQNQKGVVFMRKDEIAKWAFSAENVVPHEG